MKDRTPPATLEEQVRHDRLYRLFFESSSDAFYVMPLAEDGSPAAFVDVNQRACDMLGYSREELLSLTPLEIDAEASEALWREAHRRLARRGHDRYFRTHITREGRSVPVEISARLFCQDERTFILAVARDVSERRLAEERLRRNQADMEALVEASLEFSALVTPDTTVLRINRVGAARLGSTPEALKGKRIIDLSPSNIAGKRAEVAKEVVAYGKTVKLLDYRDGMWLENTVSPIIDDRGEVSRFAIFSRDVTVAHLSRELDALFNEIDRAVLNGTPVRALVSYACEHLARAFFSPLVWFDEQRVGRSGGIQICRGEWARSIAGLPHLNDCVAEAGPKQQSNRLRILQAQEFPGQVLLPALEDKQPASLALLDVTLPEGHVGTLAIASLSSRIFDPKPTTAFLEHARDRLQVAFEMAAEQRQLALVKQALKTAHSAVVITDADGRIIWRNDAFSRYSGYDAGEIESVHALAVRILPETGAAAASEPERHTDPFQRAVLSGKGWSGEAVSRRRDGSSYTVLQTITPVFNGRGELTHLIAIQDDISKRKLDEEKIRYLAEHDALTGTHNRGFLLNFLQHLLVENRRGQDQHIGFLYLDIDRFKDVNDHYGHAVGDALLAGFATRLRQVIRQGDLVCRIGGDEFVLVLMDIRESAEAEKVAEHLLARLTQPIDCDGTSLIVTSSIGISLSPKDGTIPETLLKKADAAMYEAKRLGPGQACVWQTMTGVA